MLIKCPECSRDVSDAAPACPGCGYPLQALASGSAATALAVTPERQIASAPSATVVVESAALPPVPRCSSCGSDDVVRVSALYEQSAAVTTSRTTGAGVGVGPGGVGVGVGGAQTRGVTESLAAKRLAPPKPFHFLSGLLFTISILLGFGLLVTVPLLGLLVFFGGIFLAVRTHMAETRRNAPAVEEWKRLWYCRRCGHAAGGETFSGAPSEMLRSDRSTAPTTTAYA